MDVSVLASHFHKRLILLSNRFYKRVLNARLGYSNIPAYSLQPRKLCPGIPVFPPTPWTGPDFSPNRERIFSQVEHSQVFHLTEGLWHKGNLIATKVKLFQIRQLPE